MKLDSRLSAKDLTVKDIAISLYQLIVSFECEKKIAARGNLLEQRNDSVKAKEYSQIYKVVMDIFDKMVAILGDEVMELDEFSEIFEAGHIAEALNIDVLKDDFESKAVAVLPKNKTIAVNCRSGRRSKNAAKILVKNGFTVIELDAGYNDWVAKGMPVTK